MREHQDEEQGVRKRKEERGRRREVNLGVLCILGMRVGLGNF